MNDCFEHYDEHKGLWFWVMLSIGAVIAEEPKLSAKKSDKLIEDFIDSPVYNSLIEHDELARILKKYYG